MKLNFVVKKKYYVGISVQVQFTDKFENIILITFIRFPKIKIKYSRDLILEWPGFTKTGSNGKTIIMVSKIASSFPPSPSCAHGFVPAVPLCCLPCTAVLSPLYLWKPFWLLTAARRPLSHLVCAHTAAGSRHRHAPPTADHQRPETRPGRVGPAGESTASVPAEQSRAEQSGRTEIDGDPAAVQQSGIGVIRRRSAGPRRQPDSRHQRHSHGEWMGQSGRKGDPPHDGRMGDGDGCSPLWGGERGGARHGSS